VGFARFTKELGEAVTLPVHRAAMFPSMFSIELNDQRMAAIAPTQEFTSHAHMIVVRYGDRMKLDGVRAGAMATCDTSVL
jgi:hypothetical protein